MKPHPLLVRTPHRRRIRRRPLQVIASALPGGPTAAGTWPRELHEPLPPGYEPEGTERRAVGSVAVPNGWWSAVLIMPEPDRNTVLLELERHGRAPDQYRAVDDRVVLSMPAAELDAVLTLLGGIVAHARRDGVLERQGDPAPPRGSF